MPNAILVNCPQCETQNKIADPQTLGRPVDCPGCDFQYEVGPGFDPDVGSQLGQWLECEDGRFQAVATILLDRLPPHGDRAELARHLIPWAAMDEAWNAMRRIALLGRAALPAMADALTSESLGSTQRAGLLSRFESVVGIRSTALLPFLRPFLASENEARRDAAVLAISQLNPCEPGILPVILRRLHSDDRGTRLQAVRILTEMASLEIDVSTAIPKLMSLLTPPPELQEDVNYTVGSDFCRVKNALIQIGVTSDHLPELRRMLRTAVEQYKQAEGDWRIETNAKYYGWGAIQVLGTLKSQADAALPEIQKYLESVEMDFESDPLVKIGDATIPILAEVAGRAELPTERRVRAMDMLADVTDGTDSAVAIWLDLARDADARLRTIAAIHLAQHPAHADVTVQLLRAALKDDSLKEFFERVIKALQQLGSQAAVAIPDLVKCADESISKSGSANEDVVSALMKIAPASPDFHRIVLDYRPYLKSEFTDLGEWVIPKLIQAVQEESGLRQFRAVLSLGDFKGKARAAVPILQKVLDADQDDLGTAAAVSLARIDPAIPGTIDKVVKAFEESLRPEGAPGDWEPRLQITRESDDALCRLGSRAKTIVPFLIERIRNDDNFTCLYEILGSMGTHGRDALPLLVERLSSTEQPAIALTLLGENALPVASQISAMLDINSDSNCIPRILVSMGQPGRDAVEKLRGQLETDEFPLAVIETLAKFGDVAGPAGEQLLEIAQGTDLNLRIAAMLALSKIPSFATKSVPMLAAKLLDSDPRIAEAAARALYQMPKFADLAKSQILIAFERDRGCTRWYLLRLTLVLPEPIVADAVPTLTRLARNPDDRTRLWARQALERFSNGDAPAPTAVIPEES